MSLRTPPFVNILLESLLVLVFKMILTFLVLSIAVYYFVCMYRRIEHTCKECPFKTRHPELLKKHMKLKHLVDSYFCDECTYAAPTLVSLNTHKGKAHPPGEAGKIKDAVMSGIIHTTDENGVRMYKCDHCDYVTNHLNNLKHVHMKKHTGELLQCDYCTYTTWSKSALNTHIKARHEEHKYRCDQCDFTSSLGFQFRRHYQSKHEGTVFKCDKCEFTAIRPEYLKKHARKHEAINQFVKHIHPYTKVTGCLFVCLYRSISLIAEPIGFSLTG